MASMSDQDQLVVLVQHAASADAGMRQAAEATLCQREFTPGYVIFVLEAILNSSRSSADRLLLILYLKYLLNKSWRIDVSEEDKRIVRATIVRLLLLDQPQLAKHSANLIARLYLNDDARHWEENMQRLVHVITREQSTIGDGHRGMMTLKELLKELRNNDGPKLQVGEHFAKIFPIACHVVLEQLSNLTLIINTLAAYSRGESTVQRLQELLPLAELLRLALRQMRMLVTQALEMGIQSEVLGQFLTHSLDCMKLLVTCCMALPDPHPLSKVIEKYLSNCARMAVDAQDERPVLLVPILFQFLEFFCGCLTQTTARLPDPLILHALVFVRCVLECHQYREAEQAAVATQLNAFFSEQLVLQLTERLLTQYLCLTKDDLARWDRSGEEFFVEEVRCAWLESVRPAAEILMGTLLRHYSNLIAPLLAQGFNRANATENLPDTDKRAWVIQTEVLFCVIGLAPPQLEKLLSLQQMMASMQHYAAEPLAWYKLLRRRIATVLETWGSREPALLKEVYRLVVMLMNDTDLVVRLFALVALKGDILYVIDHPNFRLVDFQDYIYPAILCLIRAEKETQESDTYVQLLHVLGILIRQLGRDTILEGLGSLWAQPNAQFMTRAVVLQTLKVLVEALGSLSEPLWPVLLPLIGASTDPLQRDAAQIIEEGLSLWYQVLLRAPAFSPILLQLFPSIPAIVHRERTPAAAKYAARLIEGYALLGKISFMRQYGTVVRDVLERLVTEGSSMVIVVGTINTLLQLFPSDAASLLSPTLARLVFRILTFHTVDTATMIAHYLSVFARLLLHHPSSFFAVMERATTCEMNSTRDNLLSVMLDTWITRTMQMEEWFLQKVNTMALSTLMAHPGLTPDQVNRLTNLCVAVQQRVSPLPESPVAAAKYFPIKDGMGKLEQEMQILYRTDPVHTQSVKEFALQHVRTNDTFVANFGPLLEKLASISIASK